VLVVDASAAFDAVVATEPLDDLAARLGADPELAAPHLIDLEVLSALRRSVRLGRLSVDRAGDARADFADLALTRFPHEPLAERIWELRDSLSAYDAAYVALAEVLAVPLITCDPALVAAAEQTAAAVELYAPAR